MFPMPVSPWTTAISPCFPRPVNRPQPIYPPTQIQIEIDSISYVIFHLSLCEVLLNFLSAAIILNQAPPLSGDTAAISFYGMVREFSKIYDEMYDIFFSLSLGTLSMFQSVAGALGTQKVLYSYLTCKLS